MQDLRLQFKIQNFKIQNFYFLTLILMFLFFPLIVQGAALYFLPQSQTVYQEDSFIVSLMLDTEGEDVNAIEASLEFPRDKLQVLDVGKGESVLTLWVREPLFSNQTGEIDFIGGIPEGFNGKGKLLTLIFGVDSNLIPPQSAFLSFRKDSRVLLNDGKGSQAELNFRGGNYQIIKKPEELPVITSRTHPDQNKWYKNTTLHLHWSLIKEAEYSYLLSYDPLEEPDEIADTPEGELIWMGDIEYKGLEDGIYYFSLKQKLREKDWSGVVKFRAMIDSISPEDFRPQITEIEGRKYLVFVAQDETSGVDYYEVLEVDVRGFIRRLIQKEIKEEWEKGKSPYLLKDQNLKSKISVRAVDKAGNERIAEILPPYRIIWEDIIILLVILIGIGVILWIIRKLTKATRDKRKGTEF